MPQEKTPFSMQNTIFQKIFDTQKNISNAKQDKLSNHRQEHPTKKIQNFLQNLFIQMSRTKSTKFPDGIQ